MGNEQKNLKEYIVQISWNINFPAPKLRIDIAVK